MGKSFVVILLLLLLGLGGYSVYRSWPYLSPRLQVLKASLANIKPDSGSNSDSGSTPAPTVAVSPTPEPKISFTDNQVITQYLQTNVAVKSHEGTAVCAYKILALNEPQPQRLYLLSLCQEYYEKSGQKVPGTGIVIPVALNLTWTDSSFSIQSHTVPESGSKFSSSMKQIFPDDINNYFTSDQYATDVTALQQTVNSAVY
jgi:hypothetical protein